MFSSLTHDVLTQNALSSLTNISPSTQVQFHLLENKAQLGWKNQNGGVVGEGDGVSLEEYVNRSFLTFQGVGIVEFHFI